jgi:hypothetical protein
MRQHLEICARNLGPTPRDLKTLDKKYLLPVPPAWVKNDELYEVIKHREALLSQGRVVLGARVIANQMLYYLGTEDSAMAVVWTQDGYFYDNPRELYEIASILADMHGKKYEGENEEEKEIAEIISNEISRPQSLRLPKSLTGERAVFLSAILVTRKHLSGGMLSSVFMPLLINPTLTRSTMIVPSRFWGDEWKDR